MAKNEPVAGTAFSPGPGLKGLPGTAKSVRPRIRSKRIACEQTLFGPVG